MIKKIINCLIRDMIVAKTIILISLLVIIAINILASIIEPSSEIPVMVKAVVISAMILNLAVINYGFRREESPGYKYIMRMADISIQLQIVARFILFLIMPSIVLLIGILSSMSILIYLFAGVLIISGVSLFVYYRFGSMFVSFAIFAIYGATYSASLNSVSINLSSIQIIGFSLLIYLFIALITILCEKLGWNEYSKIPKY